MNETTANLQSEINDSKTSLRSIYYISAGPSTNSAASVNNYTRIANHNNIVTNSTEHAFLVTGELVVYFGSEVSNAYGFISAGLASGNNSTYTTSNVTELITVPATKSGYVRYNICRQILVPNNTLRIAYKKTLDTAVPTTVSAALNIIDIGQYGTLTQS